MLQVILKPYFRPIAIVLCCTLFITSIGIVNIDAADLPSQPYRLADGFNELAVKLRLWQETLNQTAIALETGDSSRISVLMDKVKSQQSANREFLQTFREKLQSEHPNVLKRYDWFQTEFDKISNQVVTILPQSNSSFATQSAEADSSPVLKLKATEFKKKGQDLRKLLKRKNKNWLGSINLSHRSLGDTRITGGAYIRPALPAGINDQNPVPADLSLSDETMATPALRAKVRELGNDPVRIYEFVRNKVEYEPYYGSLKSAAQTLADMSGNDLDQAALLITLLRIAKVSARFVIGKVVMDINQAQKWLGARSPAAALAILERNGIPARPLTASGTFNRLEFDHVWVQAHLTVLPDKSLKEKLGEPVWVEIDPSFKHLTLAPRQDLSAVVGVDPRALLNEARAKTNHDPTLRTATGVPEELLLSRIATWAQMIRRYADANKLSAADLGQKVQIEPLVLGEIPLSQAWKEVDSQVYTAIPDVLRHKLTLTLKVNENNVSFTLPLRTVTAKNLTLFAKPATAADQELLNSLNQNDSLPAYLLQVIPEISLGNEVILRGTTVGMGEPGQLELELNAPTIGKQTVSHQFISGSAMAIVVDAAGQSVRDTVSAISPLRQAQALLNKGEALTGKDGLGVILNLIGKSYFYQLDELNKLDAAALDIRMARHPSALLVSYEMATEEVYGIPFNAYTNSLTIDVESDLVSPVSRSNNLTQEKQFLAVSGLTSSALEHSILEAVVGGNAVSTVRAIEVANHLKVPIFTIKPERLESSLAALNPAVLAETDSLIRDAANAGYWVIIPRDETSYAGWQGIGCIIMDPNSNAASYQITGTLQGGWINSNLLKPATLLSPVTDPGINTLLNKAVAWVNILQTRVEDMRWSYAPGVTTVSDWLGNAQNMDEVTTIAAAIVVSGPISLLCQSLSVVNISCYPSIFSPNDDGLADQVLLTADLTREATWQVILRDASGATKKTFNGQGRQLAQSWDGRLENGEKAVSGEYTLQVVAHDLATGHEAASPLQLVEVDLNAPTVEIKEPQANTSLRGVARVLGTVNDQHFSRFTLEYSSSATDSWQLLTADTKPVIDNIITFWDTSKLDNGNYKLRLTAYDTAGNSAVLINTYQINNPVVDKTPPSCSLTKPADGANLSGPVELAATANDDSGVAWVEFLLDGTVVGKLSVPPYNITLDSGKFGQGQHSLKARAADTAGNTAESAALTVSFTGMIHNFKVSPNPFSPNGDGANETTTISAVLSAACDWKLEIIELAGAGAVQVVKTGSGDTVNWVWNGRDAQGTLLPTDSYLVKLTVGTETASEQLFLNSAGEDPIAKITSPHDQDELGGVIKILGTATDSDFSHYELKYRRLGAATWTTLVNSTTPVVNGLLGELDATLLGNDFYEIRLVSWDQTGKGIITCITIAITGDLKIGNFKFSLIDMQVNFGDFNVAIIRSYDTLDKDVNSDYGYGWKFALSTVDLKEDAYHNIMITLPDGRRTRFAFTPFFPGRGYQNVLGYPRYSQSTGFNEKLSVVDVPLVICNIYGEYVMQDELGMIVPYEPKKFKLETEDGNVYFIDRNFGITKIVNPEEKTIEVTPNGVKHWSGKQITIERDSQNRITKVIDPTDIAVNYEYDANGDLLAATDPSGRRISYKYVGHALTDIIDYDGKTIAANEYDQTGRLTAIRDAAGKKIEIKRDPGAKKETIIDRNGNSTIYGYDNNGHVVSKTDALGNIWTFAYAPNGNKLMETDPLGRTTYWSYAQDSWQIASVTDPVGNVSGSTFSSLATPMGFITLKTSDRDNLGRVTSYSYSGTRVTGIKDPLGNETKFVWSPNGIVEFADPSGNHYQYTNWIGAFPTRIINPLGNIIDLEYNDSNQLIQRKHYLKNIDGSTVEVKTEYIYNSAGKLERVIYPNGDIESTEYNQKGQVKIHTKNGQRKEYFYTDLGLLWKTVFSDGSSEEKTYDAHGNCISLKGRDSQITNYIYDANNRLVKTINPNGSSNETIYDAAGQVIKKINVRGGVTQYEYNLLGQKVKQLDPLGHEMKFAYDAVGNTQQITDMYGNFTTYESDANNRLVRINYPDGNRISFQYDSNGRKITQTDQLFNVTNFSYTPLGKLTKVIDALGNQTNYTYNQYGQISSLTDANEHTTEFRYDNVGRLIEKILPMKQKETFVYNLNGTLQSKTDYNNVKTEYNYEPQSLRLLSKNYPDGTKIVYSYYPNGRIKTATNENGTVQYEYNSMGKLKRVITENGSIITYDYDFAGNLIKISAPHGVIQYSYDLLGRIETLTDQSGKVSRYLYDDLGRKIKVKYANGTETNYTFDQLSRITNVVNQKSNGEVISSHKYTLDALGNRTKIEEKDSIVEYNYDALNRLVYEHRSGSINYEATYTYDPVGNRLTKNATDGDKVYNYDANDRLQSDGYCSYSWDANGNMTSRTGLEGTTNFTYDVANHLIEVTKPDNSWVRFKYDAFGKLIVRTTIDSLISYLVDPNRKFSQVLEETTNGLTKVYTYGYDLLKTTKATGAESWFAYDGLGSTRALTDEIGNSTDAYTYNAFGQTIVHNGFSDNEFLFAGEQMERNIEEYYLRTRFYDPNTGRFISRDSVFGNKIQPQSLNSYIYCVNNPVLYIDPNGTFSFIELMETTKLQAILNQCARAQLNDLKRQIINQVIKNVVVYTLIKALEDTVDLLLNKVIIPEEGSIGEVLHYGAKIDLWIASSPMLVWELKLNLFGADEVWKVFDVARDSRDLGIAISEFWAAYSGDNSYDLVETSINLAAKIITVMNDVSSNSKDWPEIVAWILEGTFIITDLIQMMDYNNNHY